MKHLSLVILLCTVFFVSKAQNNGTPNKEFIVRAAPVAVEVPAGNSGKVDVQLLRSKNYQRSVATFNVASILPQGVTIRCDALEGNDNAYAAVITTTSQTAPGTYQVILNCTINNKTKGVIIKLKII
jgi:hypothetical protein